MTLFRACLAAFLLAPLSIAHLPAQAAETAQPSTAAAPQLNAFSGEYTNPNDPDSPLSFYVQKGALTAESDRMVPMVLTRASALEFAIPDAQQKLRFIVDATGAATGVVDSAEPEAVYARTGAAVHHVFHDYLRSEAMIPMRDGVKLHAVILKPADIAAPLPILHGAHPVWRRRHQPRGDFCGPPELARAGYIFVSEDIRGRYESQGKFVMMRPAGRPHQPQSHRREHRCLRHRGLADPTCSRQQRPRGRGGHQLRRLPGHDGGHRSASRR